MADQRHVRVKVEIPRVILTAGVAIVVILALRGNELGNSRGGFGVQSRVGRSLFLGREFFLRLSGRRLFTGFRRLFIRIGNGGRKFALFPREKFLADFGP